MSQPPDDQRSRLVSEALELALDVADEGSSTLSSFLTDIKGDALNIARKAGEQMSQMPAEQRDEFAERGGRLANDLVSSFLDVAVAAKNELDRHPDQRRENLDKLSTLVSFVGSIFIDTANKTVGTTAEQPNRDRARQITVEVAAGAKVVQSAWVVNRGAATVSEATVRVLRTGGPQGASIKPEPRKLTVGPRSRAEVLLTVTGPQLPVGSFTDSLLIVDGVGSIVVRTIIK
ncbi:hypothetical protein ACQPZX_34550 [Actinoplanes sp. CA-142083]|uniref:hypothetical protein n=1 Tax=Actinoplanes sp. CA-142083 TaxID=3239903 RepID=UPI003D9264E9